MSKKIRIFQYLVNHSGKEIKQSFIKDICNCTGMFVSKTLKPLMKKGILIRERRNTIRVINPFLLCSMIAFERKLPQPLLFRTPSYKDTIFILNKITHSITNNSAIDIINNKTPTLIHAHVLNKYINYLIENFNPTKTSPNLIVFPNNPSQFNNQQITKDQYLATDYDIYIDLLQTGKTKEALKFAAKNKLF